MKIIQPWLDAVLDKSSFKIEHIKLASSNDWSLQDGSLKHQSGRFFKIIALRWAPPEGAILEQPFVDQREVGTLGLLMRTKAGTRQVLMQAKIEPGNVGIIQLAPTCQATDSNAKRVHGGDAPPFSDYFNPTNKEILYDQPQSEQGTRFFHKKNRNVFAITKNKISVPFSHQWLNIEEVFEYLKKDFLVNTDARSALVCAPWNLLVGRVPFSRFQDGFGSELLNSSDAASGHITITALKEELALKGSQTKDPKIINLEELKNWVVNSEGIIPRFEDDIFKVRQIKVLAQGREVPVWDQPIIDSAHEGNIFLLGGRLNGILHFLFRASSEVGLYNKVELTPTIVIEPGAGVSVNNLNYPPGIIRAECRQSEEGGRFFQDINLFRIIDVGDAFETPRGYYWLTMRDIRKLLDEAGWFTNEARSALSLLLPWM